MTIRAKLYAAIVLTVLGPLATTAVALHGMAQMGDRFDEVRQRAEHESLARELKFLVTDVNGWQTAYGYADGSCGSGSCARRTSSGASSTWRPRRSPTRASGRCSTGSRASSTRSWTSTRSPGASSRPAARSEVRDIFLGPELERFEAMAATAEQLAALRGRAGGGHRHRLRRCARRGPPPADRGGARGRGGDHPAAGHGQRHRPHGARGGAQRARTAAAGRTAE